MKQMTIQRRITRNHGKRAKIGSHGFKVYKGTTVYVGKETPIKSGVSEELVSTLQDLWNNNPSTKKMRKFIKYISIKRSVQNGGTAGRWDCEKQMVEIIQHKDEVSWYIGTFYHEVEGHAFWDFARLWRREELVKFNELANSLPPVNSYIKDNEHKWKIWNDDGDSDYEPHPSMTRYANEQHSAITEIIRNVDRRETILFKEGVEELVKAWEALHY